jgi:hypothetical protein
MIRTGYKYEYILTDFSKVGVFWGLRHGFAGHFKL